MLRRSGHVVSRTGKLISMPNNTGNHALFEHRGAIRVTTQSSMSNLLSTLLNIAHSERCMRPCLFMRCVGTASTLWARGSEYGLIYTGSHVVSSVAIRSIIDRPPDRPQACVYLINHQGETQYMTLMDPTFELFGVVQSLGVILTARHIPSRLNRTTGLLSQFRQIMNAKDWTPQTA